MLKSLYCIIIVCVFSVVFTGCIDEEKNGTTEVVIVLSASDAEVYEGDTGTAELVFPVSLNKPAVHDVTVTYTIDSDTADSGDYVYFVPQELTVPAGEQYAAITVSVISDTVYEVDECLIVTLSDPLNCQLATTLLTGTILNDDPEPEISVEDCTVVEQTGGDSPANFPVLLSGPAAYDIVIDYQTSDGTAQHEAGDYVETLSGSVTIPAGSVSGSALVQVNSDAAYEPDEDFNLTITAVSVGTILDGQAVCTIVNDDNGRLYVDPTGSGADGLTWSTAFTTIQDALDSFDASSGLFEVAIWIAAGTYTSGSRDPVAVLQNNTHLYGGFEGYAAGSGAMESMLDERNWQTNQTVLDGDNAAGHVVVGADNTVIDGLQIINGNAAGTGPDGAGGGLLLNDADGVIVRNIQFQGNAAAENGGAVHAADAELVLVNCSFTGNMSGTNGGGGVSLAGCTGSLVNCRFIENAAPGPGGGIALNTSSVVEISNCYFLRNRASDGGAVHADTSEVDVRNCTALFNEAGNTGGAFTSATADLDLYNSIVWGNAAGVSGGQVFRTGGNPHIGNSCIQGSYPGAVWDTELGTDQGGNTADEPGLVNIPLYACRTTGTSTTTTLTIQDAALRFAVDDVIEIAQDGVVRVVELVNANAIAFAPAYDGDPAAGLYVENWGPDHEWLEIDPLLAIGSTSIDTGDNDEIALDNGDLDNDDVIAEPLPLDLDLACRLNGTSVDKGAFEHGTNLYFSEYVEGSGWNKALEIFNTSLHSVNLRRCLIHIHSNGNPDPSWTVEFSSGTVGLTDTFVIVHDDADQAFLDKADALSGVMGFNGDDAVVLVCDGQIVDVIGRIGVDPGTEWGSGDTSTYNHTLRRKLSITAGDPNGTDAFDPSLEWDGFPSDTFDGLGVR